MTKQRDKIALCPAEIDFGLIKENRIERETIILGIQNVSKSSIRVSILFPEMRWLLVEPNWPVNQPVPPGLEVNAVIRYFFNIFVKHKISVSIRIFSILPLFLFNLAIYG